MIIFKTKLSLKKVYFSLCAFKSLIWLAIVMSERRMAYNECLLLYLPTTIVCSFVPPRPWQPASPHPLLCCRPLWDTYREQRWLPHITNTAYFPHSEHSRSVVWKKDRSVQRNEKPGRMEEHGAIGWNRQSADCRKLPRTKKKQQTKPPDSSKDKL